MAKFNCFTDKKRTIFECSSAMQKAIRRGFEDDALYFAVELERSGFGEYAFKRLLIIASEDVGLADPLGALTVKTLWENYKNLKAKKDEKHKPERMFFIHAVLYLVRAKKSRLVDNALIHYYHSDEDRETPDYAHDMHTRKGKSLNRGLEHFFEESAQLENKGDVDDPYQESAKKTLIEKNKKAGQEKINNSPLFIHS